MILNLLHSASAFIAIGTGIILLVMDAEDRRQAAPIAIVCAASSAVLLGFTLFR